MAEPTFPPDTAALFHERSPLSITGDVVNDVVTPDPAKDKMIGQYPEAWRNRYKGMEVAVAGAGEAYQEMLGKALLFLGAKVYLYDPNPHAKPLNGEIKVEGLADSVTGTDGIPPHVPVFIESPNKYHAAQARLLIENGHPIALEKPVCLPNEVGALNRAVSNAKVPTYFTDFNHMMARTLIALGGGVKMPFLEEAVARTENAEMKAALANGGKLICSPIKKITARYFQKGGDVGGDIDKKPWIGKIEEGGGMMRDLMTRQFNIAQLIGLTLDKIDDVSLSVYDGKSGEFGKYKPIVVGNETEHRADVKGTMKDTTGHSVAFDFGVGKYAAENELYYKIEYVNGESLELQWQPPHRKNTLTWRGTDQKIKGMTSTFIDPYLLTAIDFLEHSRSNSPKPFYFKEQLCSVQWLDQAASMARNRFSSAITAP